MINFTWWMCIIVLPLIAANVWLWYELIVFISRKILGMGPSIEGINKWW